MLIQRIWALLVLLATASACVPPYVAPAVGPDGAPVQTASVVELPHVWTAGLASDGDAVFVSVRRNPNGGAGASEILRIDAQGVTPFASGLQAPTAIAVDASHVYWLDQPTYQDTRTKILRSAPKAGGASTNLAWLDGDTRRLVSTGNRLAWISADHKSIDAVAKSGGRVSALVQEKERIVAIAAGDAGLVWATRHEVRALRDGAPVTLFHAEGVRLLATHGSDVYWGTSDAIWRGGDAAPLVTAQLWPWDLVVDDTHLYWTERDEHLCTGVLVAPRAGGAPRRLDPRCSERVVRTTRGVFWLVGRGVVTAPAIP